MIYSVYDWQTGDYKYYQTKTPYQLGIDAMPYSGQYGKAYTPEEILSRVPINATYVGNGSQARGQLALGATEGQNSNWLLRWGAKVAIGLVLYNWILGE